MNVKALHTLLLIFSCNFFLLSSTLFAQQVYYVNGSTSSPGDGNSWNSPYPSLLIALSQLCDITDAEIWVAAGTYYPDEHPFFQPGDRNATFKMCNNVKIYGGFPATGNPTFEDRNPEMYPTILNGDLEQNDAPTLAFNALLLHESRSDNVFSVVTAEGLDNTAVLDGFTIKGGNATSQQGSPFAATRAGGGIYINGGSPVIRNCIITLNSSAATAGGVIVTNNATPRLFQNTFTRNFTNGDGGALYNNTSSPEIVNCIFALNRAMNAGGAILNNFNAAPKIHGCVFMNNIAVDGGAIANNTSSSPQIYNGSFSGNFAGGNGGAIFNAGNCSPGIVNCAIWFNVAQNSTASTSASVFNANNSYPNFSYSIVENSMTSNGIWLEDAGVDGGNNFIADPLFVETHIPIIAPTEIGDLNIEEESPCIDAGDPASSNYNLPDKDILGNPRIAGGTIDIGAYEFPVEDDVSTQTLFPAQFSIFPNPVRNQILVQTEVANTEIRIFDLSGQTLIVKRNAALFSTIDISMLSPGTYFIALTDNHRHLGTRPFVKVD